MNNYQCKYVGCVFMFLCVRERDREKDKRLSVKVTVLGNTANHAGTTIKWWDCCRERQDWKDKMRDKTQVLLDWRYSLIKKTTNVNIFARKWKNRGYSKYAQMHTIKKIALCRLLSLVYDHLYMCCNVVPVGFCCLEYLN